MRVADEGAGDAYERVVRLRVVHGRVAAQLREERPVPVLHIHIQAELLIFDDTT